MLRARAVVAGAATEVRQLRHRQVDLHRRTAVVDPLHRGAERRRQRVGTEQLDKGPLRRGIGDHTAGIDLCAVAQPYPLHARAGHPDLGDLGARADFDAGTFRRRAHCRGQGAHAAAHIAPDATRTTRGPHHVMQQHVAGPRRRRRGRGADDRIGRERGLERLGLEPAVQDRPRRTHQQLQRRRQILSEPAQGAAQAQRPPQIGETVAPGVAADPGRQGQQIRRQRLQDRLQRLGNARQPGLVARIGLGIARRKPPDLLAVEGGVGSQHQIMAGTAPRQRRERRGVARQDRVPVPAQVEVALDLRQQQRDQIRGGRRTVSGRDLVGHGRTPDLLAALQHQHPPPGLRQIGRADQAVVSTPHHDAVVRHLRPPAHWRRTGA